MSGLAEQLSKSPRSTRGPAETDEAAVLALEEAQAEFTAALDAKDAKRVRKALKLIEELEAED